MTELVRVERVELKNKFNVLVLRSRPLVNFQRA